MFCTGCGSRSAPETHRKAQEAASNPQVSPQLDQHAQPTLQTQERPQVRAIIVAGPAATAEAPKPPIAHEAVATIPGGQRILFAASSPTAEEILVLAQMSNDTYSGAYFIVRLGGDGNKTQAVEAVMEGTNAEYSDPPVWSPDGRTAYFTFDSGSHSPTGNAEHGLFAWEHGSGKVTQIVNASVAGLAISQDERLAAFWDYSAGDILTVYDLKKRQVVRTWADQTHSADDLVLSDLAFTPDGKSLLARLCVPREAPTMQYEIASGKIKAFFDNIQSMATLADSLYFLQYEPVPFTNQEHPHRLLKWTPAGAEPVSVVQDFRYQALSATPGSPWLVGGSRGGYDDGAAVYDTRTGRMQIAGKSCTSAGVTSSGKILYVFGNELVADAEVCNGPSPSRAVDPE